MPIVLVRHGEAVPATGADGDRFLSAKGRMDTLSVARTLKKEGYVPTAILTSPLVRAVQTAEILAHVLDYGGIVAADPAFTPDEDPANAARRIGGTTGTTFVVCHEPIVRGIATVLSGRAPFPAFATSSAVVLDGTRIVVRIEP